MSAENVFPKTLEILEFAPRGANESRGKTKFGGQPDWIQHCDWPKGRSSGDEMVLLAQVRLRDISSVEGFVYLFATHPYAPDDPFFEIDAQDWRSGENAAIVQVGRNYKFAQSSDGPTSFDGSGNRRIFVPKVLQTTDAPFVSKADLPEALFWGYLEKVWRNKIGGTPYFHGEETDFYINGGWRLLLQLSVDTVPLFWVFGDSPTMYCFVRDDFTEARLLMQEL